MIAEVDKVVRMRAKDEVMAYRMYLLSLKPFHKMADRSMDLAAVMLYKRAQLIKGGVEEDLVDKLLLSREIRREYLSMCGISIYHFNVLLGTMKKAGFIVNGRVNHKFIPKINGNGIGVLFHIEIGE